MIKGIDVSRWQGLIDWDAVVKDGVEFSFIKASGGDSGLYPDGRFARNKAEARRVNIPRGFYHFAGGVHNPEDEANQFLATVGDLLPGESLVLDWEVPHADPVEWCRRFVSRVIDQTGFPPLIYMNLATVKAHDWKPLIDLNVGLWVASWGNNDAVPDAEPASGQWPFWAVWQFSSTGTVKGIAGRVDLDLFSGDTAAFLKYGKPGNAPVIIAPPVTPPAKPIPTGNVHKVAAGETLSSIAALHGTTWQKLYQLNSDRISDPNRIYPGQELRVTGATQARTYIVKSGDTLSKIAEAHGVSWLAIYNANKGLIGPDPNRIYPGQVLVIS